MIINLHFENSPPDDNNHDPHLKTHSEEKPNKHDKDKSPFLNLPPAVSVALQKGAQWGFTSSSIYLLSHPHDDESGDDSLNYSKTFV